MIDLDYLTVFLLYLNSAIDAGEHVEISIADVEGHIEAGNVIEWLEARLAGALVLGFMPADARAELTQGLQDILVPHKGREWGVEHSGLCLLVASTVELIQQRRFVVTD
jgi:hypothetical protein